MAYARGVGRKVVAAAGTAEALASAVTGGVTEVIITAETDNTGIIVVGDSSVVAALATRKGTPLSASESIVMEATNLDSIYLDTTVSGDGVTYQYINTNQ